jgi:hypothetical protein
VENLDKDRAFLKHGGVFDDDFIDSFIELKMTEAERFEMTRTRSSSRCTIRSKCRREFPLTPLPEKCERRSRRGAFCPGGGHFRSCAKQSGLSA